MTLFSVGALAVFLVWPISSAYAQASLFRAAGAGDVEAMRRLLDGGADINQRDSFGISLLAHALDHGQTNAAMVLLERGAMPHADGESVPPLCLAAYNGHDAIVELLLRKGAGINARTDGNAWSQTWTNRKEEPPQTAILRRKTPELFGRVRDPQHCTPLMLASVRGHESIVRTLILHGADVNLQTSRGWTALSYAARRDYTEIAQILLETGTDLQKVGLKAIEEAEARGNIELTERLLTARNARPSDVHPLSEELAKAAAAGNYELVQALIYKGARADYTNSVGVSVLHRGVSSNRPDIVRILLENGARTDYRPLRGWGYPLLVQAARDGYVEIAQLLISSGVTREDLNEGLVAAATAGRADMAREFLSAGADPNARDAAGVPALAYAQNEFHDDVVSILKSAGAAEANVDQRLLPNPLFGPAGRGDLERVRFLLSRGADPDRTTTPGITALSAALNAVRGPRNTNQIAVAMLLLENGARARVHRSLADLCPVLAPAVASGHVPLVGMLLEKGADPNEIMCSGRTVLMDAAVAGDRPMVEFLIETGAEAGIKDFHGSTAAMQARAHGRREIAEYLETR